MQFIDDNHQRWDAAFISAQTLDRKALLLVAAQWAERMERFFESLPAGASADLLEATAIQELSKIWPITADREARQVLSRFCELLSIVGWLYQQPAAPLKNLA